MKTKRFLKYQLQISKRKLSDINVFTRKELNELPSEYGYLGYGETNDEDEELVIIGEIVADTRKECKSILADLKNKLKSIFDTKRVSTLIELGGDIL